MLVSELIEVLYEYNPDGEVVIFPNEIELDDDGEEVFLESGIGVFDDTEDGELHFIGEAPTVVEVDENGNELYNFDPIILN